MKRKYRAWAVFVGGKFDSVHAAQKDAWSAWLTAFARSDWDSDKDFIFRCTVTLDPPKPRRVKR